MKVDRLTRHINVDLARIRVRKQYSDMMGEEDIRAAKIKLDVTTILIGLYSYLIQDWWNIEIPKGVLSEELLSIFDVFAEEYKKERKELSNIICEVEYIGDPDKFVMLGTYTICVIPLCRYNMIPSVWVKKDSVCVKLLMFDK